MAADRLSFTASVRLYDPQHHGLHLALLAADDLASLSRGDNDADAWIFVVIEHPLTSQRAFARVAPSEHTASSTISVESQIAGNCGAAAGDTVHVALWDPNTDALPAQLLSLRVAEGHRRLGAQQVEDVRQRLEDARHTVQKGHRLVVPLGEFGPILFEVTATQPDGPVVCTASTQLDIEGASVGRGAQDPTYEDVGGLEEAIRRLSELVILPLAHPELIEDLGVAPAKGVLLVGPPGTGKTLLSRATAARYKAAFFTINGPEILSRFVGDAEHRLRQIFAEAAQRAPSIIFIDEIDAIASAREFAEGNVEVRLVSQLLTLTDGLAERGQVVVIGATNRVEALDPALRRPGRFDREIEILPPLTPDRLAILRVHTRRMHLSPEVDLPALAERTPGYVGADLTSLCREAAYVALRRWLAQDESQRAAVVVTHDDFLTALRLVQPSAFRDAVQPVPERQWRDLFGLEHEKRALRELVEWPLRQAEQLERFGLGGGGCILLLGEPLSGKSSLLVGLAEETQVSLVYVRASDLASPWRGGPEYALRTLFRKARATAPSLIVVDDVHELLALTGVGPPVAQRLLGQVHAQWEETRGAAPVFVAFAAADTPAVRAFFETATPFIQEQITIRRPGRAEIRRALEHRLSQIIDPSANLSQLAEQLEGLSIGRVLRVCDEAARLALRENAGATHITMRHLTAAAGARTAT